MHITQTLHLLKTAVLICSLVCSIVLIATWFLAYFKTKAKGFALIGSAGVVGLLGSLLIPTLTALSPLDIYTVRYLIALPIRITAFALTLLGISSLLKTFSKFK